MKKPTLFIFTIFMFLSAIPIFGQETKEINLLAGPIQQNGLPKGWIRAGDNYECTINFDNGVFYFERHVKDEKCSFGFNQQAENGDYLVKTVFEIDGNEYKISLGNIPLYDQDKVVENIVTVTDGWLGVGFRTNGEGKVWGHILKMTITKIPASKSFSNGITEKIKTLAANSPIARYHWNDRGAAPIGYIKGIALTYAKSYSELKTKETTAAAEMSRTIGDKKNDALAWYELKANSDVDRLRAIYTMALGLGMRESSGNTTVGWDKHKLEEGITPTEENSEAGLFQVSWDSRNRSPWLLKLYDQYQKNHNQCLSSTFMENVKEKKQALFGSGDGAKFQKFLKECPSFATEYVMIMLRVNRSHFGPINSKKAEYKSDAEQMFRDIEKVVDNAP